MYAGTYARERQEGIRGGPALHQRMAELLTSDDPVSMRLRDQAEQFAARAVFQEDPGPITRWLLQAKGSHQPLPMRAAATFIAPFIKTPAAILKQGAEFSPLGFAMRGARAGGREGAQALGRASLGTGALLGPLAWLAATDRLTGPSDPGERAAWFESGRRPNSVRIGDQWIEYGLFQPLAIPAAAVANAWQRFRASDGGDEAAQESMIAAVTGAGASMLDQLFLTGLSALVEAVQDPERSSRRFFSLAAQSLVPASGMLRNITHAVDPVVRRQEGVVESVKAIIPGASDSLLPQRTRFGEPVQRPGGPLRRGFMAPAISPVVRDPVADALARANVTPTTSRATFTLRGERVPLTRQQADRSGSHRPRASHASGAADSPAGIRELGRGTSTAPPRASAA